MKFYISLLLMFLSSVCVWSQDNFNPLDPKEPGPKYWLTVNSTHPEAGAIPNSILGKKQYNLGERVSIYVRSIKGYIFKGWKQNDIIISTNSGFFYTIPEKDTEITAVFEYNPEDPTNPNSNFWDPATGELIIDDFTTGDLGNTIIKKIGSWINRSKISKITVAGVMNSSDFSTLKQLEQCNTIDLSRLIDFTTVQSYAISSKNLNKIYLPESVTKIDGYAFEGCTNLSEIVCYAIEPPALREKGLNSVGENVVIRVLPVAIPEYSKAERWKDLTILPIADEIGSISISLPESAATGMYKDLFLEIINVSSAQKQRFVITDMLSYTFRGLLIGSVYDVYLKNRNDNLLGEIRNVEVKGADTKVTFENLPYLYTVKVRVLNNKNEDVTAKAKIRWFDSNNKFISMGDSIKGMLPNTSLKYEVELDKELGSVYIQPEIQNFTVTQSGNTINCRLQQLDKVNIQGLITNDNKKPLLGALVSVSQTLNGKYPYTVTAKTDNTGTYTASVYTGNSTITVSAQDFVNHTYSRNITKSENAKDTVKLAEIKGVTITTKISYKRTVVEGETAQKLEEYTDINNLAYTLYNITKGKPVSKFSVQYPSIVLLESAEVGDQIRITASSLTKDFENIESIVTIDNENKAIAQFDIVEKGAINAVYDNSENNKNVAILYDSSGQQLKRSVYSGKSVTFQGLPDGTYTLISMADNRLYNSILNLSMLNASKLVENIDYVKSTVIVQRGIIKEIEILLIPAISENKTNYTHESTFLRANKPTVIAGNFQTLTAQVYFKNEYRDKIQNIKLIVDLPIETSFVENSVMLGNSVEASYIIKNNQLTIPIHGNEDQIRFCIIPTEGGVHSPSGFVEFEMEGEVIKQPIGAASFISENLNIIVPPVAITEKAIIQGFAPAFSDVKVFDNDVFIGQTTVLANGSWLLECQLNKPYSLSKHNIHAQISTPRGVVVKTKNKLLILDVAASVPSKVTMYNSINKPVEFNFLNPQTPKPYTYIPPYPEFSFKIEFTKNDPNIISDVRLLVLTSSSEIVTLPAFYDHAKQFWVATDSFPSSRSIPVNVFVDYVIDTDPIIDSKLLADIKEEFKEGIVDIPSTLETIKALEDAGSVDAFGELLESLGLEKMPDYSKESDDYAKYLENLTLEELNSLIENNSKPSMQDSINEVLKELNNIEKFFKYEDYFDFNLPEGIHIVSKSSDGLTESMLLGMGYTKYQSTDGKGIFTLNQEGKSCFVDFGNNLFIEIDATQFQKLNSTRGVIEDIGAFILMIESKLEQVKEVFDEFEGTIKYVGEELLLKAHFLELSIQDYTRNSQELRAKATLLHRQLLQTTDLPSIENIRSQIAALNQEIHEVESYIIKSRSTKTKILFLLDKVKYVKLVFNKVLPIYGYISLAYDCISQLKEIRGVVNSIPNPCEEDESNARDAYDYAGNLSGWVFGYHYTKFAADLFTDIFTAGQIVAAVPTGGASLISGVITIITKLAVGKTLDFVYSRYYDLRMYRLKSKVGNLKCKKDKEDEEGGEGGGKEEKPDFPTPPTEPIIDPSGYVYEAVKSNRLQGVTTTIYYKTWEEDMYGDRTEKVVLWNAENYGQKNPLVTDENGMYAWDVPEGVWQVKYEKAGYQTKYSEWLPVPPPQLDVNVALVQSTQPYVKLAKGYESGIEIEFDKYMIPNTLTLDQIVVTRNGEVVSGSIAMLNKEKNPNNHSFVSKIKFIPECAFATTDKVILSISRKVKSYAGITMEADFMKQIDIEKELQSISVKQSVEIEHNGTKNIEVVVMPKEIAKGKKIITKSTSSIITVTNQAVLNAEGKATIQVDAELPGTTQIEILVEGTSLKSVVTVKVLSPVLQMNKPTASLPSGSRVNKNTTVTLSSNDPSAKIYYTLDGSCPCDDNRLEYVEPIVIAEDVIIQAIAVKDGVMDSEIATFEYFISTVVGIDNTQSAHSIVAYAKNQVLHIKGLDAKEHYRIHTISGKIAAQGVATGESEQKVMLPQKGIYILSTQKEKIKVLVD